MNDQILQNIWNYLSSQNKTSSDFETWKENVATNGDIQKNIHSYLVSQNQTSSGFNTWLSNTGLSQTDVDVAVEENPEVDIAQNNAIINSTMVGETPFTELSVEDQEKYITKSGNYATDKDGNLLFIPKK